MLLQNCFSLFAVSIGYGYMMNTFRTGNREEWRRWLADHFDTEKEVWFVFPTKAAGEESISYNDAVEEALCFGWIDGQAGTLDSTHALRRFTPRREGSPYSRPNIERLIWLDAHGMIHPKVKVKVDGLIHSPFVFPEDIMAAIKACPEAWEFFRQCSDGYRRIRIAYIDDARKRPQEFSKRLKNFLEKTSARKLIMGYGGIEKYYK